VGQREDEYHARALARWRPNEAHSAAVGFEYSYEKFGLDSPGYPHSPAFIARLGEPEVWSTDTYSILGEHQWHVNDQWTAFVGARLDKHTYTDWLFSPRAALVFSPSDKDTLKLIGTQSVRRGLDGELRAQYLETGTKGDEEKIQGLELRYERQQSDHWWLAGSAFYQDIEIMAYGGRDRIELLGEYDVWGTELEVSYRTEKTRFALSHAYTKLIDFSLEDPETIQAYSAEPYGYGDDLANWSNHVTKLAVTHDLNDQWSGNASLRVYWGYPGGEDLTHYHNDQVAVRGSSWDHMPLSDPGYDDAFDLSMHLNLGVEYRPTENLTMRLHALNTLGWFDEDLNKRNYIMRVSAYRVEAPAFTLSMTYRF
jgi:iron complex outermembrane receptor protein